MAKYCFDIKKHSRAVVLAERCAGNSEVGEMWIDAGAFPLDATLKEVIDWAGCRCEGRLLLTLDLQSPPPEDQER